jgi:hypothetical protein
VDSLETLTPVLDLSHGRTVGGEPMFSFKSMPEAIEVCTNSNIAILGIEFFKTLPKGYQPERLSAYEVKRKGLPWPEFVRLNNELALKFVLENPGAEDQFYLLTASNEGEFPKLIA